MSSLLNYFVVTKDMAPNVIREEEIPIEALVRYEWSKRELRLPNISHEVEMPYDSSYVDKLLEVTRVRDEHNGCEVSLPVTSIYSPPPMLVYWYMEKIGVEVPYVDYDDEDYGNHVHLVTYAEGMVKLYNTILELLPWFAPFFAGYRRGFRYSIEEWASPEARRLSSMYRVERAYWAVTPNRRHMTPHVEIRMADSHPIESWAGAVLLTEYASIIPLSPKNEASVRKDNYYAVLNNFSPDMKLRFKCIRKAPGVMESDGEYTIREVIMRVVDQVIDRFPKLTREIILRVTYNVLSERKVYYNGFMGLYGDLLSEVYPNVFD